MQAGDFPAAGVKATLTPPDLERRVDQLDSAQWMMIGLCAMIIVSLTLKGKLIRALDGRVDRLDNEVAFLRDVVRAQDAAIGGTDA